MRIQDPTTLVLLDGQVLNAEQACLPASWPAVLRGEGIFETFLVREQEPTPLLPWHDARFVPKRQGLVRDGEGFRAGLEHHPAARLALEVPTHFGRPDSVT